MPNTYTQLYIHCVFAVKYREAIIQPQWEERLHKYITGIVQKNGHKLLAINSVTDHLHLFIGYNPNQSLSELMRLVKGDSSEFINKEKLTMRKFQWQEGYGAFSNSRSQIDGVVKYILNQKEHHAKKTFKDEYLEMLKDYGVEYDERYVFGDLQKHYMTDEIIKSIRLTINDLDKTSLPDQQGIYAFFIKKSDQLGKFGSIGQIIYVGLSEKSLNSGETKTHLTNGQTGWSSLRRSLGAILKMELNLTAQKRDKNSAKVRADKYKFDEDGEKRLTEWMQKNLKMGYWTTKNPLTLDALRNEEENTIKALKPTLDLDKRTKKFNPLADDLDSLREICRKEIKLNI